MNQRLIQLIEHRVRLVDRAASQREALAQAAAPWRRPLAMIEHGLSIAHYLKQHPVLLFAGMAAIAVLRPRGIFNWAQRGWLVWRALLGIRRKLSGR